jgi:3-dehydro-L-gulonate 2-dehydrogenase
MSNKENIVVSSEEMKKTFHDILIKNGMNDQKGMQCAEIFTANSVDGVYTHGVNRFPRFIEYIRKGYVKIDAEPVLKNKIGSIEQWDGQLGPGPLNAQYATTRAMQLASENGLGCVALANTNHWMRGGTYGWYAAQKGFVFIGWTNTIANMPAWGAIDCKLGNNPLVIALPYNNEAIVMDMAMSQFSFGAMELAIIKNEKLSQPGGYDKQGNLTNDPSAIIQSKRSLPVGYWKGAGFSLLLDLLATILSGGSSTHDLGKKEAEFGVSQVFICIDLSKLQSQQTIRQAVETIIHDYHQSIAVEGSKIVYPGEQVLMKRKNNVENGIPVVKEIWESILKL